MKIFITGGAGFIGANFTHFVLRETDHCVTVFDALTYAGNRRNLQSLESNPRFEFVQGNVCDRVLVAESMKGHDAVVHLAAESHVDRSIESSDVFAMTNCVGTNVVCDVARRQGVARVLHVGTDEVYGSVSEGVSNEDDLLDPSSPYSATKAASDLIALSYHRTYGLPVMVSRSANQFGPFQYPEKLIPLFISKILKGEKVPLYGNGMNVRNWLYVEDNCAGLVAVLERGMSGEIYHLGSDFELTNLELTRKLLDILGADESLIEFVDDRLGHDMRYSIDSSKAKALGWAQVSDFETALQSTIQWYRENRLS